MKNKSLAVLIILLLTVSSALPIMVSAKPNGVQLIILELKADAKPDGTPGGKPINPPPAPPLDPDENDHYALLGYSFSTTVEYLINPKNEYGFTVEQVEYGITTSANTWDEVTLANVFSYLGTTDLTSGSLDGHNVVDWGKYRPGVIGVTMIWRDVVTGEVVEVDMKLNNRFDWSLSSEEGKMDVQNIVTHEFGHWAGLADLYNSEDALLTMYGYSSYGIVHQRDLGYGDILGIQAVYGE